MFHATQFHNSIRGKLNTDVTKDLPTVRRVLNMAATAHPDSGSVGPSVINRISKIFKSD